MFSSLTLACIILTAGIAMFPFVMPSSTMMNASLTMWDATSSELTLNVMTWVAVVLVPIILLYTAWCYWKCSVVSPKKILNVTPTLCTK
ncbi:cytochrome d ubiquinol oxidase subunit II [Shigella flexneri]